MPGELKPCPFNCRNGRAGLYVDLQEISPNRAQWAAYAFCDDCGSRGPLIRSDVQKVALRLAGEAWDARRTGTPEKAVRLDAARELLLPYGEGSGTMALIPKAVLVRALAASPESAETTGKEPPAGDTCRLCRKPWHPGVGCRKHPEASDAETTTKGGTDAG